MNHNIVNLVAAIVLSLGIIFGWQYFYDKPRLQKLEQQNKIYNKQVQEVKKNNVEVEASKEAESYVTTKRIEINSELLSGSIALKGLRFDDLVLLKYKQDISKDSKPVVLFAHSQSEEAYFAEIGWFDKTGSAIHPNSETLWQADSDELTPTKPVNLSWTNKDGVKFLVTISMDSNYLFTIDQTTVNDSKQPMSLQYYGLINRKYTGKEKVANILHQGPIVAIDGRLKELSFDDLKDKRKISARRC